MYLNTLMHLTKKNHFAILPLHNCNDIEYMEQKNAHNKTALPQKFHSLYKATSGKLQNLRS